VYSSFVGEPPPRLARNTNKGREEFMNHAEVERTELADDVNRRKELNFRKRLSEVVCKSPYAAMMETGVVVNDKENRRLDFCRCVLKS